MEKVICGKSAEKLKSLDLNGSPMQINRCLTIRNTTSWYTSQNLSELFNRLKMLAQNSTLEEEFINISLQCCHFSSVHD